MAATPKPPPTRLEVLEGLKAALIAASANEGQLPAVSKELRAVLVEIESLAKPTTRSVADELAAQRSRKAAPRGATAADPSPAARRGQSRRSNASHRTG